MVDTEFEKIPGIINDVASATSIEFVTCSVSPEDSNGHDPVKNSREHVLFSVPDHPHVTALGRFEEVEDLFEYLALRQNGVVKTHARDLREKTCHSQVLEHLVGKVHSLRRGEANLHIILAKHLKCFGDAFVETGLCHSGRTVVVAVDLHDLFEMLFVNAEGTKCLLKWGANLSSDCFVTMEISQSRQG